MSRRVPRALLFYNPAAPGVRRGLERKLEFLSAACKARPVLLDAIATGGPGDVLARADSVAGKRYDLLIAWGGDGTVNEVGNLASRLGLPLGILPGGTINLLARELGIPARYEAAADLLFYGSRRAIKAGRAGDRLFFSVAGAGFDAAVCRWVPPLLKRWLGPLAYVVGGARQLLTYPFPTVSVLCGNQGFTGTQMVIGAVPHYAGSLKLLPLADLDSPVLDLCVLRTDTRLGYLRFLGRLLIGRHTSWTELVYYKGWNFSAMSADPVPVQIDGEFCGMLPMRFEMVPEALEVLAPSHGDASRPGSPLAGTAD